MDAPNDRRYHLQTTCSKNGGFRHYVKLPPQSVFQHVYWVLGSEIDVRIKRKQTFFNRETDWMRLPVYMTITKGMLIIYFTNDSGYILRIPGALKANFNGKKTPDSYLGHLMLQYPFGEVHLRLKSENELRTWRTLILAAHESENGLARVGQAVANHLSLSTSMESVISTKSVAPTKDKKAGGEMIFHRYRRDLSDTEEPEHLTSTVGGEESVVEKSISDVSVASNASALRTVINNKERHPAVTSSPHLLVTDSSEDEVSGSKIESDYEASLTQQGGEHLMDISTWEPSALSTITSQRSKVKSGSDLTNTSEVDVSFKDLNPYNCSTTSVHTAILNHNDVFIGGVRDADDVFNTAVLDELPGETRVIEVAPKSQEFFKPAEPKVTKVVAETVKPTIVPAARKVSFADLPKVFEVSPLVVKKAPLRRANGGGSRLKALDFWKQKENENNNVQVSPVKPPRVHFKDIAGHNGGRVFNSPTKFYNTVDEAAAFKDDKQQQRGGNESRI